jgi:hypothetical protein
VAEKSSGRSGSAVSRIARLEEAKRKDFLSVFNGRG